MEEKDGRREEERGGGRKERGWREGGEGVEGG